MSWFDDIKQFTRDESGSTIRIRLQTRKIADSDGEKRDVRREFYVGSQWVGYEYSKAGYIDLWALYSAITAQIDTTENDYTRIIDEALFALVVASDFSWVNPMIVVNDMNEPETGDITGFESLVLEIPFIRLHYHIEDASRSNVEKRNVFMLPCGLMLDLNRTDKGDYQQVVLQRGFTQGFQIPGTSIIGLLTYAAGPDIRDTLVHEYFHASYNINNVKDKMYGDAENETSAHFITDFRTKLNFVHDEVLNPIAGHIIDRKYYDITHWFKDANSKNKNNSDELCPWALDEPIIVKRDYMGSGAPDVSVGSYDGSVLGYRLNLNNDVPLVHRFNRSAITNEQHLKMPKAGSGNYDCSSGAISELISNFSGKRWNYQNAKEYEQRKSRAKAIDKANITEMIGNNSRASKHVRKLIKARNHRS